MFDRSTGGPPKEITRYKQTAVQGLSWSPDGTRSPSREWDPDSYSTGNIYRAEPVAAATPACWYGKPSSRAYQPDALLSRFAYDRPG